MKEKIKKHFRSQFERFKQEIKLPEYIWWWITRGVMIWSCFYASKNLPSFLLLAVLGNFAATFAVPLLAALFPQSLYFGRIPYRAQSYINFFVFIGSFLNQCVRLGRFVEYFDKWQHFFAGLLGVFLGCILLRAISPETKIDKRQELCGGVGFSVFLMLIWEMFEFFADYYIEGSCNQGYGITYYDDNLWFKIFGFGAQNEGQTPLYDTFFDITTAVFGMIIGIIIFLIGMKISKNKESKNTLIAENDVSKDTANV